MSNNMGADTCENAVNGHSQLNVGPIETNPNHLNTTLPSMWSHNSSVAIVVVLAVVTWLALVWFHYQLIGASVVRIILCLTFLTFLT
jgi:hypothetical protein